jgi:tyrosyl-tRNA synthetase
MMGNLEKRVDGILRDFARTTKDIVSLEEFRKKLLSGNKLIIKYGADCTAPFLHLGHAVNLWMMRRLQEEGHKVIFLLGDFTTKIGDPTGKSTTRPVISEEDIEKNAEEFIKQVSKVLITDDPEVFEIRRNSEWYNKMGVQKFLQLISMVTHSKLAARDMFQKRMEENSDIYMHEMLYPVLQGYDSVELKSDLTIVGTDQLFNEALGRFYQEKFNQPQQVIITTKITPGLCGKVKQSKSLGNYIAITDTPKDKFGKVMKLPDELIIQWMEVYTDISADKIFAYKTLIADSKADFRMLKLELAEAIVARYHGEVAAKLEANWFLTTFGAKEFPKDAAIINIGFQSIGIMELIVKCCPEKSKSEIRKLILQGAVKINDTKIVDLFQKIEVQESLQLKIGKRNFFEIKN